MAIECRQCGRAYADALFELGRTIWCTCGSRVGIEPPLRHIDGGAEKRFIADAMLGRLARWLRLLGFDCAFDAEISDQQLVRRGVQEKRIILTRDRRLPEEWRVEAIHLVRAEDLQAQLAEVVDGFGLAPLLRPLTRCSECNDVLVLAAPAEVSGRIPSRILATHEDFLRCPGCGRVYWEGSHSARIRLAVDRLLGRALGTTTSTPPRSACRS